MQFKHVINVIASPPSNGKVESVNRTLLAGLNNMWESECSWDSKLSDVAWGINKPKAILLTYHLLVLCVVT